MYKRKNPAKESAYDHYAKRHRSPSPYRQESSRIVLKNRSSEDDYKSFQYSSSHESRQRDSYKRKSACSPPDDEQFHSRYFPKEQKEKQKYSKPTKTKSQEPESKSGGLHDFLLQLHALPAETFLKIVYFKLDQLELEGFAGLSELAKFINKVQDVLSKSLPPEVLAVVKQMMFSKVGTNLPGTTAQCGNAQVSESRRERQDLAPETDFSFIRDILNQSNTKDPRPSDSLNVASRQNVLPYPGVHGNVDSPHANIYTPSSNQSYSYNTASSNPSYSHNTASSNQSYSHNTASSNPSYSHNTASSNPSYSYNTASSNPSYSYNTASSSKTPGIPGLTLTEEQKESFLLYNAYQSQQSDPSSSIYHNYKF